MQPPGPDNTVSDRPQRNRANTQLGTNWAEFCLEMDPDLDHLEARHHYITADRRERYNALSRALLKAR